MTTKALKKMEAHSSSLQQEFYKSHIYRKSIVNIREETSQRLNESFKQPISTNKSDFFANLKVLKLNIDEVFVESLILEVIKDVKKKAKVNKVGIDYKPNNLYFWFEINDNDEESQKHIENIFAQKQKDIEDSGLLIENIVIEKFANLEIPINYKVLV